MISRHYNSNMIGYPIGSVDEVGVLMCLSSYDADSQMRRTWKSSACMALGSQQRDLISTKSLPPLIVATFHSALIHQLMEIQRVVLRVGSNLWMVMKQCQH